VTEEEHKERHQELHKKFDELFADFISHANGGLTNTIHDLIVWSHQQTQELDHEA